MSLKQPKPTPGLGPGAAAVKHYGVYDIFGNNNYQTTGDLYTASQFGIGGVEFVDVADRTHSGTYSAAALPPANSSNSSELVAPCANNFTLHYYSANGTEVANNTDLSAEILRIKIMGV